MLSSYFCSSFTNAKKNTFKFHHLLLDLYQKHFKVYTLNFIEFFMFTDYVKVQTLKFNTCHQLKWKLKELFAAYRNQNEVNLHYFKYHCFLACCNCWLFKFLPKCDPWSKIYVAIEWSKRMSSWLGTMQLLLLTMFLK